MDVLAISEAPPHMTHLQDPNWDDLYDSTPSGAQSTPTSDITIALDEVSTRRTSTTDEDKLDDGISLSSSKDYQYDECV